MLVAVVIVRSAEDVNQWAPAQRRMVEWRDNNRGTPLDLYLLLVVIGSDLATGDALDSIANDRSFCRKIVIPLGARTLLEALADGFAPCRHQRSLRPIRRQVGNPAPSPPFMSELAGDSDSDTIAHEQITKMMERA
jgi:hypothetical protein